MTLAEVRGSEQPFAGWQFVDGEPVGVPALLMEQPGPQGWSAMIWQLEGTNDNQFQLVDVPELTWGGDPTTWSVRLRAANATLEVKREGSTLSVLPGADARPLEPGRVTIATDFDVSDRVRQIRQDFVQVRGKYRADQLYVGHRRRLIASLALAFVIQECALFALGRRYILVRRYLPSLLVGLWVITLIGLSFFFASLVNLASRAL
jgi:hypothetical protein